MNGFLTADMSVLRSIVLTGLFRTIVMLVSIPAHELAHAAVSNLLGDPTAKNCGRLTMNPMAHFDPIGALCLILVGVGWAKPVPINPNRFRNPQRDTALSAAAGPAMNLILAYVAMILYKLVVYGGALNGWQWAATDGFWAQLLVCMITINITLTVFNLLPVPPFDGGRIFCWVLPKRMNDTLIRYERYLFLIILAVMWTGLLNLPLTFLQNLVWNGLVDGTGFVEMLLFNV